MSTRSVLIISVEVYDMDWSGGLRDGICKVLREKPRRSDPEVGKYVQLACTVQCWRRCVTSKL